MTGKNKAGDLGDGTLVIFLVVLLLALRTYLELMV